MRGIIIILLLALLTGQALGEDVRLMLGNVSVQYEVPTEDFKNGFSVGIQKISEDGLPSFTIPLGMMGGAPELSMYPDNSLPSTEEIKDFLGYGAMPDSTELVELAAGPWQINNQTGVGGYILKSNLNGKGERNNFYGKVSIYFKEGPYLCQVDKPLTYEKSEKDIRNEMTFFNMSLRRFRVQLL